MGQNVPGPPRGYRPPKMIVSPKISKKHSPQKIYHFEIPQLPNIRAVSTPYRLAPPLIRSIFLFFIVLLFPGSYKFVLHNVGDIMEKAFPWEKFYMACSYYYVTFLGP